MANPYLALAEEEEPKAAPVKPAAGPAPAAPVTAPPPQENPYEKQVLVPVEEYEDTMDALVRDKKVPIGQLFAKSKELGREINPKQQAQFRDQVKGLRTGKYSGRLQFQHNEEGVSTKDLRPDDLPIQSALQEDETSTVGSFIRGLNTGALDIVDDVGIGIRNAGLSLFSTNDTGENFFSEKNRKRMQDMFVEGSAKDHAAYQRQHQADEEFHNTAQTIGQGTGIVASMAVPGVAVGRGIQAARLAQGGAALSKGQKALQAIKIAGIGSVEGGAATIGGSEYGTKMENAPVGAAMGAVIAPAAAPLVKLTGAVAKRLAEVTGVAGTLRRVTPEIAAYANRMSDLTKDEIAMMREKVQAFRRAGVDPNLNDVLPRKEQDRIRALARKDTKGRDIAYEGAEESRRTLGQNIRGQFDRVVNPDGTKDSAAGWGERIKGRRNYDADRAMNTMRNEQVEFGVEIGDILGTRDGQRAWSEAIRSERDPAVRQTMEALPGIIRSTAMMNASARAQVFKQTGGFTIGMADRLRRKLNDAGQAAQQQGKNDLAANMFQAAKDVASAARRSAPEYDKYLTDFAEDSRSLGAIDLGGKAFDKNTDEFVRDAVKLGREQNAVHGTEAAANIQRGLKGKIIDIQEHNSYGQTAAKVKYQTPDGDVVEITIGIPPRGSDQKVASLSINKRGHDYGDAAAFNTIGPDEMRDLAMYAGQRWPWLESVSGQRVGGAREAARQARYAEARAARRAAEDDAGVITEFDDGPTISRGGPTDRPQRVARSYTDPIPDEPRAPRTLGRREEAIRFEQQTGFHAGSTADGMAEMADNELPATPDEVRQYLNDVLNDAERNSPDLPHFVNDVTEQYNALMTQRSRARIARGGAPADATGDIIARAEREAPLRDEMDLADDVVWESTADNGNGAYVPRSSLTPETASGPASGRGVSGLSPQETANEILAEADLDAPVTPNAVFQYLREYDDAIQISDPGVREFVNEVSQRAELLRGVSSGPPRRSSFGDVDDEMDDIIHGHEVDDINLNNIDDDLVGDEEDWVPLPDASTPRAAGPAEDSLDQRVSELHDEYLEVRDSYSDGAGEFPDFEQWLGLNFYDADLSRRLGGAQSGEIDNAVSSLLSRILRDEAGSKAAPRLPTGGMFRPDISPEERHLRRGLAGWDVANTPPTQTGLPSNAPPTLNRAVTGPMNSGGVPRGPSTRHRIQKLSNETLRDVAQVPTHPTELDAPSDQMLAILAMRRKMEAKMGESAQGPAQMGNAMAAAPEQQARNAAIMGEPVAAELQRGMAATMIKHGNAMRTSPAHGSSTALNQADDANLGNIAGVAMDAAMGNKVGLAKRAIEGLSKMGMRDADVENIIRRALDDGQVDQLIDELERSIPNPEVAREVIKMIREAGTRAVGMAVSEAYPAEEQ
jgi:hypothetical protein